MRLIGVVGVRCKLSEIPLHSCGPRKIQKALETKHRLEELRPISHRNRKSTLDLPATETNLLT
jgi:hypothetical protein